MNVKHVLFCIFAPIFRLLLNLDTKEYQEPETIKKDSIRSDLPIQDSGSGKIVDTLIKPSNQISSDNNTGSSRLSQAVRDSSANIRLQENDSLTTSQAAISIPSNAVEHYSDFNYLLYNKNDEISPFPIFDILTSEYALIDSTGTDSLATMQPSTHISRDQQQRYEGKPLPFSLERTDFIFALMLVCLMFFAHIGGFDFLKQNLQAVFSARKSNKFQKDTNIKETLSTYFLVIQTIILSSICLFNELVEYDPDKSGAESPLITILTFVSAIIIFLIIKLLVYKILGYIFDLKDVIRGWIRTYIVVLEIYGLLFFIPTLLLIYSNYWHLQIACFMLAILIIGQIILFYRIAVYFIREKFNFLFLIAYLCSLEIIPYLLLAGTLVFIYSTDVLQIIWH